MPGQCDDIILLTVETRDASGLENYGVFRLN